MGLLVWSRSWLALYGILFLCISVLCRLSSGYPRQVFYFVFIKSLEPSYVPCDVLHWSLVIIVPVSCLCVCVCSNRELWVFDYCHFIHITINLYGGYSGNLSDVDHDVPHHQPFHDPLFILEKSGGVYCLPLAYGEVVTSHASRLTLNWQHHFLHLDIGHISLLYLHTALHKQNVTAHHVWEL